jgi:hypothetical protein
MKKIRSKMLILSVLIAVILFNNSAVLNDDELVDTLAKLLIKEYDNFKNRTAMEKMILRFTKKAFVDSVEDWRKNYKNLDELKIKLHPTIERMIRLADKNITPEESLRFRKLFEGLTVLGYKNLQIYYVSTKKYLEKNGNVEISLKMIDEALTDMEYYNQKAVLYSEEENIKSEIRKYFKDPRLKSRMSFYSFAFDFLDKIRVDIIKKDMEEMKRKIGEKESLSVQ